MVDVTGEVAAEVDDSGGTETETVTVFVDHTTAGIVINEAEPRLLDDIRAFLSNTVPDEGWRHDQL